MRVNPLNLFLMLFAGVRQQYKQRLADSAGFRRVELVITMGGK